MAPPPQPDLPRPAHADRDSALGRKFGKEVTNYFGGSPLNRLSFLREDHDFLAKAFGHPTTLFVVFKNLSPLIKSPTEIHYATYDDIKTLVPSNPFEKTEKDMIEEFDSRIDKPQLVFLGVDENVKDGLKYRHFSGAPHWAIDITPKKTYEKEAKELDEHFQALGLKFSEGMRAMSFPADVAAEYAQGRHYLDWNYRNTFCGTCGHKTLSVHAGGKRICPPKDQAENPPEREPCATRTTLSNLTFPRTDPTIIVAVLSHDSKRLLLGRQKRWPPYWFSTLAGFIEPAESVEDAVRREVWEESGVILSRVLIHSTQPWPYPANLMIGAIAQVASPEDEAIKLEHDPELEIAKWFTLEEVQEALKYGTSGLGEDAPEGYKEGNLRLPPKTAIANQLITAVVEGGFLEGVTPLATANKL
ncbi:NADH pyrophosphatase [Exophiala xenobiotica]|uniref:NAD(+) diphosphatase n=1 Tax=Vermiconidia calcicola TaxID=1690605 RepID=A0AAV9QDD3_9PEZI|nr:NADH pyrophosphatase [Exophiala xenobiotica]KAK5541155.1 NADH pyrophosphatase [Vermiconidia calcicola]KAK5549352.1 NADH pyrophosphatase [Chaetothyriales sp. CCFEE 6169]KAK5270388.1 NADH pyrophosphatase [Exophiala xenobiotica]KAK5302814.1 NADH pyrophosphatase [Exophiala xenobiotica]